MPAKAFYVALYFVFIRQIADLTSPVINAYYSLKWSHNLFDFPFPMDSYLVINISESAKRKLAKPVTKKEPIEVEL